MAVCLESAYPWEYIRDNIKTFRFIIFNYFTNKFDPCIVESIGRALTRFVRKYVYPSWRVSIEIQYFIPPSQETLIEQNTIPGAYINAIPQPGTFIPVYLVDEFGPNIESNFATGVHGCVSGSVMNGIDALFYLNDDLNQYGPLPFGTPFIVIPAGSTITGNGVESEVAANRITRQGPTKFYQCLSQILCHHVLEVLIDSTGVSYIGAGNPLGLECSGSKPVSTRNQIFYLKQAVTPFSQGKENLYRYKGWTMTNFAYPAYFFPFNRSGIYDFLGKSSGPFIPYQGSQFVLYQDASSTNFQVGNYVSTIADPYRVQLVLNGSIYEYEGWGLRSDTSTFQHLEKSYRKECRIRKQGCGFVTGLHPHRHLHSISFESYCKGGCTEIRYKPRRKKFNPLEPQLLPFTYIDADGFLTVRLAVINYSPILLPPKAVDLVLPILEKYVRESFLPYWNVRVQFVGNYTITSKSDLPIFDGTFMPFFVLRYDQFNFDKLGGLVAEGGATNVNNNPNILAGPCISEYVLDPPNLPLGCPYLMISDANFPQNVTITTNNPNVGPFIAAPAGSTRRLDISYPIVAGGTVASPDISACIPPLDTMAGKIGVNVRAGCNSIVYPENMEAAGAIATITVFDGGAIPFTAPDATKFNCTVGPEGYALIEAIQSDPNLIITISAPAIPTDIDTTINIFSWILSHEAMELASDPTYANYIATSNPPVDKSILFSQYENVDAVETINIVATKRCRSIRMSPLLNPSFFVANLRSNNYDNTGTIFAPLVPQSRQQIVYQVIDQPLQVASSTGLLSGGDPNLTLNTYGSIFDPQTFYPPGNPYSYQNGPFVQPVPESPLATIYDKLLNQRNVFLI